MTRRSWVNPIMGPISGRGFFHRFVKVSLEWHMHGLKVPGELDHHVAALADLRDPILGDNSARQNEGITKHKTDGGKSFTNFREQIAEEALVFGHGNPVAAPFLMPCVVDSNQDADHVGVQVNEVRFDPGIEIDTPVAADSPVQELKTRFRTITEDFRSNEFPAPRPWRSLAPGAFSRSRRQSVIESP